jgi:signal peptidase I
MCFQTHENRSEMTDATPPCSGLTRWLRIITIGRNPKVTLARIVILAVVSVGLFKYILLPVRVDGISMLPTYQNNRINFINRLAYMNHPPQRGDVVGIRLNSSGNSSGSPHIMYLKRIVGLPGETISFANGKLLINGTPLPEPYLRFRCDWNAAPVINDDSQYYVVGDNRSMAQEDHEHGRAERSQIVGKVLF